MTTTAPFDGFDRVYVINLPQRRDRRREMAGQLARIGLALDRPPVQLFPGVRPATPGPFATVGTHGCFLSHLGVLRDARRAGHRRIAILEDDVDFTAAFTSASGALADRLRDEPWHIFYGGHRIDPALCPPPTGDLVGAVDPALPIGTAHFVAFSGDTIPELAGYLERMLQRPAGDARGGPMHVDGAYAWYRAAHPARRTLIAEQQLAVQRPSRTDIHALRWFDRLPLVRDVVQALRRRRRRRA